jgi:GTP-binding protein
MIEKLLRKATFATSAAQLNQIPKDSVCEVAFAGRSNSGKSSVINCLTGQKKLARTSKTPGRTQLLNYFILEDNKYIVDLPGYGFAKVNRKQQLKWQEVLAEYFYKCKPLQSVVLIMDIRHPLKESDVQMLNLAIDADKTILVLLNKADKLSKNLQQKTLMQVKEALGEKEDEKLFVELFSASKKTNIQKVSAILGQFFSA